jgi:CRISPR-associated protein Cas1
MILVIDRRNSSLEIAGNSLIVRIDGVRQSPVPLRLLTHLIIARKTQLSSSVLTILSAQQTVVTILGGRFQDQPAMVLGLNSTQASVRRAQYAAALSPEKCLQICRVLVNAKTRRQLRLLRYVQLARPDKRYAISKSIQVQLNSIASVRRCTSVDSLRGIEGANAAAHFKALTQAFPPSLGFTGRHRRPPPDPVNALLSLSYTILYHSAATSAHKAGLDPLCGFLHEPLHGRHSLASDLTELLRANAEQFVWNILRDGAIGNQHFVQREGSCLLGKTGRSLYYQLLSAHKPVWEKQLDYQARRLRRFLEATTS